LRGASYLDCSERDWLRIDFKSEFWARKRSALRF
jgi:hypothetical protein